MRLFCAILHVLEHRKKTDQEKVMKNDEYVFDKLKQGVAKWRIPATYSVDVFIRQAMDWEIQTFCDTPVFCRSPVSFSCVCTLPAAVTSRIQQCWQELNCLNRDQYVIAGSSPFITRSAPCARASSSSSPGYTVMGAIQPAFSFRPSTTYLS